MKYIKYIIIATILFVGVLIFCNVFTELSLEERLKNQLNEFLSLASKSSGDKLMTSLLKSRKLKNFFMPHCSFYIGVSSFSGLYTPMQISANSMRCRSMFKYINFVAHDIAINLHSEKEATVNFTGSINAVSKCGESINNYKELTCKLHLDEEKWLISEISVTEIIKK